MPEQSQTAVRFHFRLATLLLTALAAAVFKFEDGVAQARMNRLGMHGLLFMALCFVYCASQFETNQRVLLLTSP